MSKTEILNVNVPGHTTRVDTDKYEAMRAAILDVTPFDQPGLTAAEMVEKVTPLLPTSLWPGGEKVGWWQKTVQLDLEARGLLRRDESAKPLRWHRS